jgi:hypothetical protein
MKHLVLLITNRRRNRADFGCRRCREAAQRQKHTDGAKSKSDQDASVENAG